MKLPTITNKQQEILKTLYRYRFLNRIQIQALLHHKDYKTINLWLKDLKEKEFVMRIYSTDFMEKNKPAVYYLGLNGIRWLRANGDYPDKALRQRYRETDRSAGFIARSKLVADICIKLEAESAGKAVYACDTPADFSDPASDLNFLIDAAIQPHLHYLKQQGGRKTHYLLEIIDPTLPQYRLRKRLKDYVTYLADSEWEGDDAPVTVQLVLPTTYLLIYAKRAIRRLREDVWDKENVHVELSTTDKLSKGGVLGGIWEKA